MFVSVVIYFLTFGQYWVVVHMCLRKSGINLIPVMLQHVVRFHPEDETLLACCATALMVYYCALQKCQNLMTSIYNDKSYFQIGAPWQQL